jgi:hypothetical protein
MATYLNDLRLTELATGEGSGTWGTTTNLSLELIGEALGYATQQVFGSDADATTTIADGASDPARAMYFKITSAGSLTATRTCTIAPNTISRVMFIENATTGSQSIQISQGSGASVTILAGKTAVVYLDGAGAGAAVVDAMAGVDPGVTDTLAEVLAAGNTSGANNLIIDNGQAITTNTINETTAASGVTIDSVLLKDDGVNATNLEITNLKANDGTSAGSIADSTGVVTIASAVLTTADINGGTIDGTVIGGTTPAAVTTSSLVATTADINAGTIDGTVIGGSTAAAGTFTTGQFNTSLNVDGTVTADGLDVDTGNAGNGLNYGFDVKNAASGSATSYAMPAISWSNGGLRWASVHGERNPAGGYGGSFVVNTMNSSGSAVKRLGIDSGGDISFYEDTGTTAQMVWDASADSLTFADNAKAIFGAGSDLEIYHDGTNNRLTFASANTYIQTDGTIHFTDIGNSEKHFTINDNGAVDLYYDNVKKLATTATGIDVTGTVTADGLTVQTTNGLSAVLESTNSYQHLQFKNSGYIENYIDFTNRDFNITCDNVNRFTINGTTGAATFGGTLSSGGITTTGNTAAGTASAGDGRLFPNNAYGAFVYGNGTTYDVALGQRSTGVALGVLAGTTNVVIPSGNLLVGTSSASGKFTLEYNGSAVIGQNYNDSNDTNNSTFAQFAVLGVQAGTIKRVGTTSAVIYNTSSDYRLKTVISPVEMAGLRIDSLRPVEYEWKSNGLRSRGFLAHEFGEVYPSSVSGDKDAVDDNGNPVYQSMQASTSEVIADLVSEIQSLRARITALEGAK